MLIPSRGARLRGTGTSLSRGVNANSQHRGDRVRLGVKSIKSGEC